MHVSFLSTSRSDVCPIGVEFFLYLSIGVSSNLATDPILQRFHANKLAISNLKHTMEIFTLYKLVNCGAAYA